MDNAIKDMDRTFLGMVNVREPVSLGFLKWPEKRAHPSIEDEREPYNPGPIGIKTFRGVPINLVLNPPTDPKCRTVNVPLQGGENLVVTVADLHRMREEVCRIFNVPGSMLVDPEHQTINQIRKHYGVSPIEDPALSCFLPLPTPPQEERPRPMRVTTIRFSFPDDCEDAVLADVPGDFLLKRVTTNSSRIILHGLEPDSETIENIPTAFFVVSENDDPIRGWILDEHQAHRHRRGVDQGQRIYEPGQKVAFVKFLDTFERDGTVYYLFQRK